MIEKMEKQEEMKSVSVFWEGLEVEMYNLKGKKARHDIRYEKQVYLKGIFEYVYWLRKEYIIWGVRQVCKDYKLRFGEWRR